MRYAPSASLRSLASFAALAVAVGCQPQGTPRLALGPADGHDLPPTDLERVAVNDTAPLFTLESFHGDTVSLADFRGEKNVVLVFYRGHW